MRKYDAIKKVELHCRLDGSLDLNLASNWMGVSLSEAKEILTRKTGVRNLSDYLKKFEVPIELLQLKSHLKSAAYALCMQMKKENVIYAEIRLAPIEHTKRNLTADEVIEYVLEGIEKSGLKANLILTMKREDTLSDNKKVIRLAKKYLNKGVCAVDLSGDESIFPTISFKELFEYANEAGIPFTITCGETGTYRDIDDAISFGAKRIGHGVLAIKNFKTMENLKKNDIPLELCITSNLDTKLFDNITEHPIKRLIDSGVKVTVNTGNRTISKTDLAHEYYLLNKYLDFNDDDFNIMNRTALLHSFLPDEDKVELLKMIN